uniref:Uncharacterized protein n=1 Tax=Glossina pallidipes TaxID=7398 RepID=A0A1A9Z2C6_GLOPL
MPQRRHIRRRRYRRQGGDKLKAQRGRDEFFLLYRVKAAFLQRCQHRRPRSRCSNAAMLPGLAFIPRHQQRLDARLSDIPGHPLQVFQQRRFGVMALCFSRKACVSANVFSASIPCSRLICACKSSKEKGRGAGVCFSSTRTSVTVAPLPWHSVATFCAHGSSIMRPLSSTGAASGTISFALTATAAIAIVALTSTMRQRALCTIAGRFSIVKERGAENERIRTAPHKAPKYISQ